MKKDFDTTDCYTISGKLALPYTYFAGRTGSTFITTIRDNHKIMGVKCDNCNKVFVPPRQTCEKCMAMINENWIELKNEGRIENYTIVRYKDNHLPRKVPYILAMIKLENSDTPLIHIVEGVSLENVKEGMKVKAVFAENTTNTILDIDHFEPI